MSLKVFFIGILFFALVCIAVVSYDAYRGKDWKTTAIFMLIGWFIAVGQLASNIK